MTIKFNPSIHLSRSAFSHYYENQRKDKEWERAIQEYSRILDRERMLDSFRRSSETLCSLRKYNQERKAELEKKWPQLKKVF